MDFNGIINKFDYRISEELIAQKPASPRDSAKLLVYQKEKNRVFFDTFINLPIYLPQGAILVFNKTKVIPARLALKKPTGGKVKILYVKTIGNLIEVMADRKLDINSSLVLNEKIYFVVKRKKEKFYFLQPSFPVNQLEKILIQFGETPIPPYIKNSPLSESQLRKKYQTIFAKNKGSIAAPTASLHFTRRLMEKLKKNGFPIKFVTLHVNLGTFAPLTEKNFKTKNLHEEYYEIDKRTANFLNQAKNKNQRIIAVGTTTARVLESSVSEKLRKNKITKLSGNTNLFIQENYKFKFVDGLITNFHVPKSSLLMLVSAFVGREKILTLYEKAKNQKFKFFSFGDGMLIY